MRPPLVLQGAAPPSQSWRAGGWCGPSSHFACPPAPVAMLPAPQVTRLQYLNALLATRAQALPQSPENTELLAIPGSQTRLLGDKAATAPGEPRSRSVAPW